MEINIQSAFDLINNVLLYEQFRLKYIYASIKEYGSLIKAVHVHFL